MKHYVFWALVGFIVVPSLLFGQVSAHGSGDQLQELVTQLQQSPGDQALRESIINLARTMHPPPGLPEEAGRRMARGFEAFKDAKSASDYKDAATEFEKATLAAPWYADAYYNLGQARAKAEDYAGAARSLKLYLLAAPEAKDAAEAKMLMYAMEYKQEKLDKERSAMREGQEQADYRRSRLVAVFGGIWKGMECYVGKISASSLNRGCTGAEMSGRNWGPHGVGPFKIESDGTVNLGGSWGCKGEVFAILEGSGLRERVRWEVRPKEGSPSEVWGSISNDGTEMTVSCNRPLAPRDSLSPLYDGAQTKTTPYMYIMWTRQP